MRAPVLRAILTRRSVQRIATSAERHTGCDIGSFSTLRSRRSRSIISSSEWNAARRPICERIASTPASSSTSSDPVDDPMKTLTPAAPGNLSSSLSSAAFSCVPPTQNAKSQCIRCVPRFTLSASVSALVVCGSVFGISNTVVTPPITAANDPVSRSSLCIRPGSRKCTWVSITPGST